MMRDQERWIAKKDKTWLLNGKLMTNNLLKIRSKNNKSLDKWKYNNKFKLINYITWTIITKIEHTLRLISKIEFRLYPIFKLIIIISHLNT